MVDRDRRRRCARILRNFLAGLTTNREFEDQMDELLCRDGIIHQAAILAWFMYDDLLTHRLTGRYAVTPEVRGVWAPFILFLYTDLEYEGPKGIGLIAEMKGALARIFRLPVPKELTGNPDAWPFFRSEDFEDAKRTIRLLGSG